MRTQYLIEKILPGLKGWAQNNGLDELPNTEKVALDLAYLQRRNFYFDIIIFLKTITKVLHHDDVNH
jgi:O-antigen biosynthesis protein WbqP